MELDPAPYTSDIVTSPEMHDVWVSLIGPQLAVVDIVQLSMVSRWGRRTAHHVTNHRGYATVRLDVCHEVARYWPLLKLELALKSWKQDNRSSMPCSMRLYQIMAVSIVRCEVLNYEFVDAATLEEFVLLDPKPKPGVDESARDSLDRLLVTCGSLTSLTLSNCVSGQSHEAEWLMASLLHLPAIRKLDLSANSLGPVGSLVLSRVLGFMPHITSLHLQNNAIGSEGMTHISPCLTPHVTNLDLSTNKIGAEGAQVLESSLAKMTHLTILNLGNNPLKSEGAKHVTLALRVLTSLTFLNLSVCSFGADGMKSIAPALCHMSELTELDLSFNNIGHDGAKHLAPSLFEMPLLTSLNLRANSLGAEGVRFLAPSLSLMCCMTKLHLSYNNIEGEGAKHLAPSLSCMPLMTSLNLSTNRMREGVMTLVPALAHMPRLSLLDLSYLDLNDETRASVKQALFHIKGLDIRN